MSLALPRDDALTGHKLHSKTLNRLDEISKAENALKQFIKQHYTQESSVSSMVDEICQEALAGKRNVDMTKLLFSGYTVIFNKVKEILPVWREKAQLLKAVKANHNKVIPDKKDVEKLLEYQYQYSEADWKQFGRALHHIVLGKDPNFISILDILDKKAKQLSEQVLPESLSEEITRRYQTKYKKQIARVKRKTTEVLVNSVGIVTLMQYGPSEVNFGQKDKRGVFYMIFLYEPHQVIVAEPFRLNNRNATYIVNMKDCIQDWETLFLEHGKAKVRQAIQSSKALITKAHTTHWRTNVEKTLESLGLTKQT